MTASGITVGLAMGLALSAIALSASPVQAQSNLPYNPARGVGMSSDYRQTILNDRLLGIRPSALVRNPGGQPLYVERSGDQAFLRSQATGSFLIGVRPNSGWPTGLGSGLGWGNVSQPGNSGGYGGFLAIGDSLTSWIAMLPAEETQANWANLNSVAGSSPVDVWIRQL